jgi:hypothetical protein
MAKLNSEESWYAMYIVYALMIMGVYSMIWMNFVFKVIGLITVLCCILVIIAKMYKGGKKNE